jgi:hypothetical protein
MSWRDPSDVTAPPCRCVSIVWTLDADHALRIPGWAPGRSAKAVTVRRQRSTVGLATTVWTVLHNVPSETTYIAGATLFISGLLCLLGGVPVVGAVFATVGAGLWVVAWRLRGSELRNCNAYFDSQAGPDPL